MVYTPVKLSPVTLKPYQLHVGVHQDVFEKSLHPQACMHIAAANLVLEMMPVVTLPPSTYCQCALMQLDIAALLELSTYTYYTLLP